MELLTFYWFTRFYPLSLPPSLGFFDNIPRVKSSCYFFLWKLHNLDFISQSALNFYYKRVIYDLLYDIWPSVEFDNIVLAQYSIIFKL